MSDPASTIRSLARQDQTRAPQVVQPDFYTMHAQIAEVHDDAARTTDRAKALDERVQHAHLEQRAATRSQSDSDVLLAELSDALGMPWSLVARLLVVSPTAVRKWRKGGALTPDSRLRLARLVVFCEMLREADPRIVNPALWLQTQMTSSTVLTRADLYALDHADDLLLMAAGRRTPEDILDTAEPDWRSSHPADDKHRVVRADDGVPSIVPAD